MVAYKEFATAYSAETSSMFDEPTLSTERKSTHGLLAYIPIDRRDE
jgi:hypothetical protein